MDPQCQVQPTSKQSPSIPRACTAPISSKVSGLRIHSVWRPPALLPASFPAHLSTFYCYTNSNGVEIPLLHRDKVTRVLRQLDTALRPVVAHFKVRYTVLAENHPQEKLAAFTLEVEKLYCVRVRVRNPACPNDVKKFYARETLFALLFHELAHVRYMHHGRDFMLLLRDIYRHAAFLGIFQPGEANQIPSCRRWEALIYDTAGGVSDAELVALMEESRGCDTPH